jgi:hypothetical protein
MRAGTGKPLVYLAILLPLLVGGMIGASLALVAAYAHRTGTTLATVTPLPAAALAVCGALLAIPLALLLGNGVLFAVPSLRRIAQADARRTRGPGFAASQRVLSKAFAAIAAVCVPIVIAVFALAR